MSDTQLPVSGFKECDIRGEMNIDITTDLAYRLGRAVGTLAEDHTVLIGGDFRISTPALMAELAHGAYEGGAHVISLGQLATPGYYFARRKLGINTGVMITASHSPVAWNGFKIILGQHPITPEELEKIKELVLEGPFASGGGTTETIDIRPDYIAWLVARFAGLKDHAPAMVFDCGNGASGWAVPSLVAALNLNATVLFPEPDGTFPNRHPDIARPEDLALLQQAVLDHHADLGAGFDGDGDRVGIVDHQGQRILSDHLIAWLARELLTQHGSGAVVYDLKLSKAVPETITTYGGQTVPQKSGHTFIKAAMQAYHAIFGGEYSGHLFFDELNGEDDGMFAALLIASLAAASDQPLADLIATIPHYHSTPDIRIHYSGDRQALIDKAIERALDDDHPVLQLDGVKVMYEDGWALMRASVTEPALTFRFEGTTISATRHVADCFLSGLGSIRTQVLAEVEHCCPRTE